MPKRKTTRRKFPSTEVQGADSWIVIKMPTWGELKELKRLLSQADEDDDAAQAASEAHERMMIEKILDWNWVDDDGNLLPLPSENAAVLNALTGDEMIFIAEALRGDIEDNEKKG
jgi:hypothetical protein